MPRPRICVVIQAVTTEHAVNRLRSVEPAAPDLIEIRLDYARDKIDLWDIRSSTGAPLIATCRANWQRGCSIAFERERVGFILKACEAGFQYADIEFSTPNLTKLAQEIHDLGSDLIVSHHDCQGTPGEDAMEEVLSLSLAVGGDVCKVVGTANTYEENLAYLDFVRRNPGTVSFGMGLRGVPSRLISPLVGGAFTYASAVKGEESAPGQLTLEEMRGIYALMGVGA